MLFYFACEAAGALSARHSLRPLMCQTRKSSGKTCAQAARSRRCGLRRLLLNDVVLSYPSPLWGGWPAEGRSGGGLSERAHPHIAPTPASASLWPTLPTKGGGIRKSELRESIAWRERNITALRLLWRTR